MKLGIVFQGECRNKDNVVRAVQRMAKEKGYRVGAWKEGMRVVLCPTGYVDLGWVPVRSFFGRWKITGSCVSVPAGPGFHRAAAELIQALGEKEIKDMEWKDSTNYLEDPDFEALRRETFEPWLAEQLKQALEELDRDPEGEVRLFWDEDQYWPEKVPGTVVTPVGRFSRQWLGQRLERGALRELSERLFLWNEPGHDARFHRNCALKRLWEDCYFAPSDRSGEDAQINGLILDDLEKSAQMDPELPLPVESYRELCILDDRGFGLPEDIPELEEEFAPGYHKGEVTQSFDTLRFPLPGVYRYEWNEDGRGGGGCIWWDEESDSPLWRVSGYRSKNVKAAWNADLAGFSDVETREEPGFSAHWGWKELEQRTDPEKPVYQVLGEVVAGPTLFVFTVTFSLPEEREDIYARIRRIEAVEREEG